VGALSGIRSLLRHKAVFAKAPSHGLPSGITDDVRAEAGTLRAAWQPHPPCMRGGEVWVGVWRERGRWNRVPLTLAPRRGALAPWDG
jgi:hypothetical protein